MTDAGTPKVVIADPLAQNGLSLLQEALEVVIATDTVALSEHLEAADALVVRSRTKVTAGLLEGAPHLRLVGRAGIGVDNVDIDAATRHGVLVVNAPLGNVRSTAEHTLALIFALARRVPAADAAVRDGTWKTGYEGLQVAGKRLGIVGLGKVGSTVASLGAALGMQVSGYDPYLSQGTWPAHAGTHLGLSELLQTSDILTLHVPLLETTRHLIDEAAIAAMKPGALLVNCARGGLVDEEAVAEALRSGHLGGAAFDVFETEPPLESPLLHAPNAILTPHVAASTREAQTQVSHDIAVQVLDYFAGRPVEFPVNPAVLESRAGASH